ncbi:hypothetical protein [Streptomyces prasinopilosus]|uniref:hypothetical protein n=1 Tax=Streptomyces prasinopilosus TaxID=67344 RepID=UPI0012FEC748|nr:hypothetical protein [Streptomyces prasinopilosus]
MILATPDKSSAQMSEFGRLHFSKGGTRCHRLIVHRAKSDVPITAHVSEWIARSGIDAFKK